MSTSAPSTGEQKFSICRVCGFKGEAQSYSVREMMFGWKDVFDYFQCPRCQCLQIRDIPQDLARFYPVDYGAYNAARSFKPAGGLKNFIRIWRNRLYLDGSWFYSVFLKRFFPFYGEAPAIFNGLNVTSRTRILDVGCGDGNLLLKLANTGFRNLTGLEPFQKEPVKWLNGVRLLNGRLEDMKGQYDFVMLHHVFEHMPDPHSALKEIYRLLSPRGVCLLRIPTVSSYAWKKYGVHWVQLDAPRHLYLFSVESLELLAERYQFEVIKRVWDSTEFQIWGSEQYLCDIPLMSNVGAGKGWFQPATPALESIALRGKAKAEDLNRTAQGDQIQFFLRKKV